MLCAGSGFGGCGVCLVSACVECYIYIYTDGYINIIHSDLKYNLLQKQKLR